MADDLNILLGTKIDDSSKSVGEINKQITELNAKVKSLKINIDVDDKVIRALNDKIDNLRQQFNLNIAFNTNDKSIINTISNVEKISDEIDDSNNALLVQEKYFNSINKTVLTLKENIRNLSITKGIDSSNFENDIEKMQGLMFNMKSMDINSELYSQSKVDLDEIIKKTQYKLTLDKNQLAELKKQEDIYIRIDKQLANLNDVKVKNDKYDTNEYTRIADGYEKIRLAVQNGSMSFAKADTELKKLSASTKSFEVSAKSASNTTNAFSDTFKRFLSYFSIYKAINLTTRAITEMAKTVRELDTVMYNIRMVTSGTIEQTKELMLTYNQLGKELGATTIEVATSANEWLRQGKSIAETNTLIKNSMILSKIGMLSSADSTKFLTSAMKGFNIEASKSLDIADKLSAIDVVSATSAGGLAEALSRTASSAQLAGVEIDKLLGYIALVGETTQKDMASIGESFKTIFSRMGNVKLGQFVDEDGNDITTQISDVEKVLSKVDIKLRSSATEFRDFGEVLDDVGKNWKSFNEVEQNAIATTFAGMRQRENFLVLMQQYDTALKYTETSLNSAGTAMKKFEIYQDSIDAKLKKMTTSLELLATKTLNSGLLKFLLDMGAGIIDLVNAFGGLVPVLTTVGLIWAGWKTGILPTLIGQIQMLMLAQTGYTTATVATAFAQVGLAGAIKATTIAIKSFLLTNPVGWAILATGAIFGLIKIFDALDTSLSEQKKKVEEAQTAYSEITSELKGLNEELKITNDRIRELQIKGSLTLIEKDELSNLQKTNYELQRRKELLEAEEKIKSKSVNSEVKKEFDKEFRNVTTSRFDGSSNGLVDFNKAIKQYQELDNLGNKQTKEQTKQYKELQEYLITTSNRFEELAEKIVVVDEDSQNLKDNWLGLSDLAFKVLSPDLWKDNRLTEVFNRDDFAKIKTELIELSKAGKLDEDTVKSYANLNTELENIGVTAEEVVSIINDIPKASDDIGEIIGSIKDNLSKVKDSADGFSSTLNSLNSVYNDLVDGQDVEYSTITKLIAEYPKYATALSKINDNKQEGITLVEKLFNIQKKETEEYLKQIKSKILAEEELNNLKARQANIGKSTRVTQEQIDIYNRMKDSADAVKTIEAYEKLISESQLKVSTKATSSSKSSILDVYEKRKKAIEHEIFLSKQLQTTYKETSKEYITEQEKQYKKYKELQELASSTRKNLNISPTSDEGMTLSQDWWSAYNNGVDISQDKLNFITTTYEKQNQLLEDRLNLLDVEQSKYNTTDSQYKGITQQKYDIILQQEELLQKQIANLYKQGFKDEAKELEKVSVDLYKTRIALAKEFQSIEVDTLNQQIDNTEKVNNALNTLQKAYVNMRKRQLNETKKMYQEEMKYVDEVYNAKKKALQKERDDRYDTRDLSDKTKSVSDIQSQLDLIKNDETQMAKRLQLEEELAKAKRELDDFNYDQNYDKRVEALELSQQQAKEEYEYRIELLEERLNDEQWMMEQFNKDIQNKSKATYQLLMEDAKIYSDTTTVEIAEAWDICTTSLSTFETKQFDVNRELENMVNTLGMIKSLMEQISSMNIETYSDKININTSGGNIPKHHTGINAGVVGGNQYSTKSMEQLTKLLKGELVVNTSQADNFMKNVLPNMSGGKEISINQGDIIVQGSVDKDSLSDLKKFVKQSNDGLIKQLKETFSNKGIKPNFKNAY